ncbi:MAG TPA: hypothetical protein VHW44_17235 [Pseudonocardiaceae bacterium]|jgi:predicted lipoprotein with Yx(FWY)xxD motif|nr:hypothetical protein [Pseudonocardiaceae bacterium]
MNRVRAIGLAGIAATGAVMLAACSGTSGTATDAAAQNTTGAAPTSAATGQTGAIAGSQLTATTSGTLGSIVVDGKGMTLYRFDKDTPSPVASNCYGTCATEWPPVLVSGGQVSLSGVDSSEVGTVTRTDGSKQLTIGHWPVYEYAGDSKPGDTNGEGVGGTWYVVTPQGKKAVAAGGTSSAPATSADSGSGSGGGSGYGSGSGY